MKGRQKQDTFVWGLSRFQTPKGLCVAIQPLLPKGEACFLCAISICHTPEIGRTSEVRKKVMLEP